MFEAWGHVVHRHRLLTLIGSGLLLAASIVGLRLGGVLTNSSPARGGLEYAQAARLISGQIPQSAASTGAQFEVVFTSQTLKASDPAFRQALEQALARLRQDPRVKRVSTPYDGGAGGSALVSRDGHQAAAVIETKDQFSVARTYYPELRAELKTGPLNELVTGDLAITQAFDEVLQSDLRRAELVSLPLSMILLLLVFGALVAALLPIGVGLLAVVGGLGGTLLLARFTDVSQYALNIVTLIGLGVAIDYSLFIVNRFREELASGRSRDVAVARTVATAGRAITFSGITVAIGLSGMLFFRGTFLASMGVAGAISVALAVVYALTFLPALLSLLGPGVDRGRVGRRPKDEGGGFWRRFALAVMRRPLVAFIPALGCLLLLGLPFTHLRLANGSIDGLPPGNQARQGYDALLKNFPGQGVNAYEVVVQYGRGGPLTPAHVGQVYDLVHRMARIPGVVGVSGMVDTASSLSRAQYQRLYREPLARLPAPLRQEAARSVGKDIAVLYVNSDKDPSSDGARHILATIRGFGVPGARILVTGQTAFDVDTIGYIVDHVPEAIGFVLLVTLLVLFFLTGSVLLPLKAVLVNLLSIAAAFGALVFIFQDGHLSSQLGFTPQSVDPTVPVLLFCIVFGLSMDYEVFLVSRIQEEYQRLGDNRLAVAEGLHRSGRLITGAAAIMVAVFGAFAMAQTVVIKEIGLGLAIAVAVDATLVRALVVPAVMRLLGRWNWWAPPVLAGLYQRLGMGEMADSAPVAEAGG